MQVGCGEDFHHTHETQKVHLRGRKSEPTVVARKAEVPDCSGKRLFHSPNQTSWFNQVTFSPQTSYSPSPTPSILRCQTKVTRATLAVSSTGQFLKTTTSTSGGYLLGPSKVNLCRRLGILLSSLGQRIVTLT